MTAPAVLDTPAGPVPDTRPPSRPKGMIDAFLTEHRHHSILSATEVIDLLLDLRAEV